MKSYQNAFLLESSTHISRREFVKGLALGGVVGSLGFAPRSAWAQKSPLREPTQTLSGTNFDLQIDETPVNFTGATRNALTVNHSLPAPILRLRQGDTVTLRVSNMTSAEDTSIHWHGILLPANMDGVPGLSFHGIPPGGSYLYRFNVRQSGTYWYHSHSGFQKQRGLYGALIIDPLEPPPYQYDREHVILAFASSSLGAPHEGDHGGGPIDRTFKIEKTGEVNIGRDVKIGDHFLKRGKYLLVHRAEEQRHVFVLTEVNKKKDPSQLTTVEIDSHFIPASAIVKKSGILAKEQRDHSYEVAWIRIAGENGDHVFVTNTGGRNASR